nr:MAG TPA: hypothetical protein [Caudoviricetes sp.]
MNLLSVVRSPPSLMIPFYYSIRCLSTPCSSLGRLLHYPLSHTKV